jgi:hypothetical protein
MGLDEPHLLSAALVVGCAQLKRPGEISASPTVTIGSPDTHHRICLAKEAYQIVKRSCA